jgi:acyl-coenzyme A thioesterase PaaI-like protein
MCRVASPPLILHWPRWESQGEFKNRRKSRSRRGNEAEVFSRQNPPPYVGGYHSWNTSWSRRKRDFFRCDFFRSTVDLRASTIGVMVKLPHTKSCFVCGLNNPIGLKLDLETDGVVVRARFVPRPEHVGFRGTVHGGLISTVLDEAMVWAIGVHTKRFAYCAELRVRFLLPVRPDAEFVAVGELVANRRGKLFETRAELRDLRDEVHASATGKYLPITGDVLGDMRSDFAEDAESFFAGLG